jgi:tetratricopeptide (TPR) repeat protein
LIRIGALFLAICGATLCFGQDDFEVLLRRAFELHRTQQYGQSIPLLERARALRRRDYSVNLLLGIDYLRSGQPRRALPFFETARKINSMQPEPLGYEAEAYTLVGEFDRTVELLQAVAERSGEATSTLVRFYLRRFGELVEELRSTTAGLARVYRLQAIALHERRDPKESEALLRVQALMPEYPGIESALGQELLLRSRFQDAAAEFSRALARDPGDVDALAGSAVIAARDGNLPEAKRLLKLVCERSPHRLKIAYHEWPRSVPLASELVLSVERDEAAELSRPPPAGRNAAALLEFGAKLAHLDRWEEAIAPLEQAWHDNALRLDAACWLALCYSRGAEHRTQQLGANRQDEQWLAVVRGEVLLRLVHDGPAASAEFRKAVALSPADPALRTGLAEAELLAGDTADARMSARKALEIDPQRTAAMRAFAEAAIQERDYTAAISELEKLLAAHNSDITAQVLLGTAYARTGAAARAVRLLQAALSRGYPDEKGTVHYMLGTALRQLGREQEAARLFQQAQTLSDAFAQSAARSSP